MTKPSPYISVIVSGRNDNYGGDFTQRIQNQISWLGALSEEYQLPIEYVLVNYNPIDDQPTLRESLDWPTHECFRVLQVTVPADVHMQYEDPEIRKTIPLYEFIAKNAGIRRSIAPYILTTNADILFHPSLIENLSKQRLQKDVLYRTDRLDHRHKVEFKGKVDAYLKELDGSVFKYFFKGGTYEFNTFVPTFKKLKIWHNWLTLPLKRILKFAADLITGLGLKVVFIGPESLVHCNASGDFLLAHRDHYHRLRGFPEDTYISTHTDSLMVFKFLHEGLKIQEFAEPVYHADHERRFKFDTPLGDPDMAKMFARLQREISEMKKNDSPTLHNDENWGLNDQNLPLDKW